MDREGTEMKVRIFDRKLMRKMALAVLTLAVAAGLGPVVYRTIETIRQAAGAEVILIDPGHGGMDGGASSAAGLTEKNITLSIALRLREAAEADGFQVVMTREGDKGPGDGKGSLRSQKTADLNARAALVKKVKPAVAVSIHLNSFKQDTSVRGAQTFYPAGSGERAVLDESKKLAEAIQAQLISGIADGTDRAALGKADVLLLKNPAAPIALVECGFLSNPEEARLLEQPEYQGKLAKCIYEGILLHMGKGPGKPAPIIDSRD
jgi:N-acetylmuramoyl-L-alanine amidase